MSVILMELVYGSPKLVSFSLLDIIVFIAGVDGSAGHSFMDCLKHFEAILRSFCAPCIKHIEQY